MSSLAHQTSQANTGSVPEYSDQEQTLQDLFRLLTRLEHNLLRSSDNDAHICSLRRSKYDRMRVGSNVEHARRLINQLERSHSTGSTASTDKSSSNVRAFSWPTKDTAASSSPLKGLRALNRNSSTGAPDLKPQKALVTKLQRRLEELARQGEEEERRAKRSKDNHHGARNGHPKRVRHIPIVSQSKSVTTVGTNDDAEEDENNEEEAWGDEHASDEDANSDGYDSQEEEDILEKYVPGYSSRTRLERGAWNGGVNGHPQTIASQGPHQGQSRSDLDTRNELERTSTLRARGSEATLAPTATTTATSISPKSPTNSTEMDKGTTKLLESHDSRQNDLTESLLSLATALKESTLSFSDSVNDANPLVDQVSKALDENVMSMEGASKRMGALRRITEGKGWWDRLGLWARIGVLWVVLIVVVGVVPNIRFRHSW